MTPTRSRQPLVLQGYFRAEQLRRAARTAGAIQPVEHADWAAKAPRPDLMPARTRGGAVQARRTAVPVPSWPGAPRPDLLPGMGAPRGVAQPRSSQGVSTVPIPAGQLRVIGQGRPLEPEIRQAMETFFQADFSGVRVHEGPAAPAMGALAFTLGEELHFAPGLYDPDSPEGVALLGHELTHVVQQRDGRVANPYGQGIAIVQDPALEAEADRMGQQIADEMWSGLRAGQPAMRRASELVPGRRSRLATAPPRAILASSEGFTKPKGRSRKKKMTREEAWADDEIVGEAQNVLNAWCQRQDSDFQKSKVKPTKWNGEDLIICLWVYFTNAGNIDTAVATNENPGQKYRSMTKGKPTVCAEDVMCREREDLTGRTLYSIAYNATQGMTWPACSTVNGGCRGLLESLGIVEPPYAGLERDLGGERIYDT